MSSPFWSFDPFLFKIRVFFIFSLFFLSFPYFSSFFLSNNFSLFRKIKEVMRLLFPSLDFFSNGLLFFLINFFIFICFINLSSLFCYIFSPLAHIILTILLSLIIWLSSVLYQLNFFLKEKVIHLTPKGTPLWLLFFIVIIELVRQLIRPITLGVRLAANLTAGHLILTLLASIRLSWSFLSQMPLILLEIIVSLVQPFVFCLLSFLYFSET